MLRVGWIGLRLGYWGIGPAAPGVFWPMFGDPVDSEDAACAESAAQAFDQGVIRHGLSGARRRI